MVLKSRQILACLLAGLVGCSTPPHDSNPPGNWISDEEHSGALQIETVTEGPKVAPPPQSAPRETGKPLSYADTWIPLDRFAREQALGPVAAVNESPNPIFALRSASGVFEFQANSYSAKWKGLELRLGFVPQLINGELFMHTLDLQKNVLPLVRPQAIGTSRHPAIVIDPGHGGSNLGTVSVLDQTEEKAFTLDLARRIEIFLSNRGCRVFLTRTNDSELSLSNRVSLADAAGADLFVSLHFNSAAPSQQQNGLETFCVTPSGMPSTLTRGYEDDQSLAFPNNVFDSENLQWAMRLHAALLQTGFADRGVRRARFLSVLRGQHCPAVLIEAGYLSNPEEARRIGNPDFRQRMAQAIADALVATETAGAVSNARPQSENGSSPTAQAAQESQLP